MISEVRMTNSDEGGRPGSDHNETRLGRWECVVIKCFAILFLILFLSEKAIKEVGSIRRTWANEIAAPLEERGQKRSISSNQRTE